jgi:predicted membrane channel-forming protein YqfA (hemolysin III family)
VDVLSLKVFPQYPHNDSNWSRTLPYGVVFLLMEEISLNHAVWHFFVLAAAVCHYVAILMAVASN